MPRCTWSHITLDFATGFPTSAGRDRILTIVDTFSKSVHFVPLQKSPSASKMGDLVVRHIFRLHAIPMDIVSDTGPKIFFPVWKAFCSALSASPQSQTVWFSAKNIPLDSRKLVCRYIGPFVIINSSTVRLKLPQSPRVYPSFHVSQLKRVPTRPLVRLLTPPPTTTICLPTTESWTECLSHAKWPTHLLSWRTFFSLLLVYYFCYSGFFLLSEQFFFLIYFVSFSQSVL